MEEREKQPLTSRNRLGLSVGRSWRGHWTLVFWGTYIISWDPYERWALCDDKVREKARL